MGKGSFIGGAFVKARGESIQSHNPARNYELVFESHSDISHVELAVKAAENALPAWRCLSQDERILCLNRLEAAFKRREHDLSAMITAEMGKVQVEAHFEAKNVSSRIALTVEDGLKRVQTEHETGTRYHAQGVMAVLGPYNFPAHLMNSHIIPALLSGNTVVAKPSELCPGVGEIYAECFEDAGLPAGVFNLVQGRGDIGKALVTHTRVRGVLFTGSYQTGRALNEMLLDHPHKILALEMGGKNTAVVLDDADLYQALIEITQGCIQSAGQRCTATGRVLIERRVADKLIPALVKMASEIKPADPTLETTIMGPLASRTALERFMTLLEKTRSEPGCKVLLEAKILEGGAYVTPSIYQVEKLSDTELFGPHYDIQIFDDLNEAIRLVNESQYGLSNSIFTRSEAKFERFYRETYCGVLNWNKSTNGVSGKAPFGGVGKSGNFRPAGIDAVRNTTYPVAIQKLAYGQPDPLKPLAEKFETCRPELEPSLQELVSVHEREFSEQRYRHFESPHVPHGVKLPASEVMLQRLYKNNFVPKEKKELVADLFSSTGPFLVSIDEEPLVLFDAASQIASLGIGFSGGMYQKALDEGTLTSTILSNAADIAEEIDAYKTLLLSRAHESLKHVTFTTSGACANEKAFDLCRINGPGGTRIIAFEGAFHGRTMMSLQTTYNPEKRAGFEMAGYEAIFLKFGDLSGLEEELRKGNLCAVIVEPVQCEGGDNFASVDFFRGLRQITRKYGVPLIFDEVQTGFGLFGPFFYHTAFGLTDGPDCVTLSKKAQLGAVLSAWEDTRPEHPHLLSIQRGLLQAKAVLSAPYQEIERCVGEHLAKLAESFPQRVLNPRNTGYGFAFDMQTPLEANHIVNQRFERGFMVYIAGTKTLRFRANIDTTEREIRYLFDELHRAIGNKPAAKTPFRTSAALPIDANLRIEPLNTSNWADHVDSIQLLEQAAYEPSRQDTMEFLYSWLEQPKSIGLLLKLGDRLVGFAIGGPLEHSEADGPMQDPMRGLHNTFYSTDVNIHESLRGKGAGYHLKKAQIEAAKALGYSFMTGRNRVGSTEQIQRIAKSFGAYQVAIYDRQYGGDAQALYYRIPLLRPAVSIISPRPAVKGLDWSNSIQAPLGAHALELASDLERGIFTSAVGTKLTLGNFITPDFVRYTELLRYFMPKSCRHLYMTSGRDEMVDKGLRSLRVNRPKAQIAIGLQGQYLGHTTAAARSLTDPEHYEQPFGWFNWPLVVSSKGVEKAIQEHGADQIFAIVVELFGEMSGQMLSHEFLNRLDEIREQTGIPLVYVETASSLGRNAQSMFLSDSLPVKPNMVWWYAGAQLGHIFVDDANYVPKPLTLISTWDGDEISMRRTYRHLLVAHEHLQRGTPKAFENALAGLASGAGLYHMLDFETRERAENAHRIFKEAGLLLKKGFGGKLIIEPPINVSPAEQEAGVKILKEHLPEC